MIKFEEALNKLERIVQELEGGNLSLDKAIKIYQQGLTISKQCLELLDKAEKKIEVCSKDKDGNIKIKPFKENSEKNTF
jgi:exodeoxyribonuclease VII small subunit